jgi:DnaK suppressor protein
MSSTSARTARSVAHLRALLEERRRLLKIGLNHARKDVRARGETSRAIAGQDWFDAEPHDDLDIALLQTRHETLAGIDAALGRLDAGTYGMCRDCDQPIALERLHALPFAARCMPCEEAREEASRRRATKSYPDQVID